MSKKPHTVKTEDWKSWWIGEALTADPPWRVQDPYGRGRNMSGCPDLTFARSGRLVFVFVRPASDPTPTAAQRDWIDALVVDGGPAVLCDEVPGAEGGHLSGPSRPAVAVVVSSPGAPHRDIARALLA